MSLPTRDKIVIGNPVQVGCRDSSGEYYGTTGEVQDILTNADQHPHGIKVRLTSGVVGRVKALLDCRRLQTSLERRLDRLNVPVAPHAVQTAVAKCVERLLQESSYPAQGKDEDKRDKRYFAREKLADLVGALQVDDLPDETVHITSIRNLKENPQRAKIWGEYLND
jgi:uncharacterized repeat protein (TIGR03833 family)